MPVLLVGTMAMSTLGLGVTASAHRAKPNNAFSKKTVTPDATVTAAETARPAAGTGQIILASVSTPATYTVRPGDTVSGIAERFGQSTASILALNGLSWKSLIFPRQVLRLTRAAAPIVAPPASSPTAAHKPTTATYTIASGDTITRISKKFGVTVPSILAANHLGASSIIYAGRTLIIPTAHAAASTTTAASHPTGTAPAQVGQVTQVPSASVADNARTIIAVGRARGVPSYGIVVALAAALQESGLRNLDYGDRDSVGLFQQRPSAGWGSVSQLVNPTHAAELFYGGPANPNRGKTRGLLDIPGWQSMSVTQAAQAVQNSAYPNAYAKWEKSARAWLTKLG
jgi:LysM repeat protein